ncbi:MAG: hypothetical protein PVH88_11005 [Ignavibacteria bacterium]|jgi:hypothetical protein
MKTFVTIFILFISFIFAQSGDENWVHVSVVKNILINTNGLDRFQDKDIYVWVMENHSPPLKIESVKGDIYKSKTYYLFNKETRMYSFLEKIYYDEKNNVLKSFSYKRNMDVENFKYNYPVLENSDMEKILNKCLEYTAN